MKNSLFFLLTLFFIGPFSNIYAQVYSGYSDLYDYNSTSTLWDGNPTYRDDYIDFLLSGGYQQFFHDGNTYYTGTIHAEAVFSFFGSRAGLTIGPDYISFSPFGLLLFAPAVFSKTINDGRLSDNPLLTVFMITAVSAAQWHIPCSDHVEINLGWDALKFVKMKDFNDRFYVAGSLNAGLTGYIGDNLYLNAYYEFNHNHNPAIGIINWMFKELGASIDGQPKYLNGHSFGIRLGWQFGE